MKNKQILLISIFLISILTNALAHGEESENNYQNLSQTSITLIVITSLIVIVLVAISILYEKPIKKYKKILFLGIIMPIILTSLFMIISTIYLNAISETKGPVHWHADFEIWNCGKKLNLVDPRGFSNREGTSTFHEHNDNRIHIEGLVYDLEDIDLDSFIDIIGGSLTQEKLIIPTNDGIVTMSNGDQCDGKPASVQVFVYHVQNPLSAGPFLYRQEKLEYFEDYIIAPYQLVPPGDCIIIEFAAEKENTDKICETYRVAQEEGDIRGS